MPSQEQHMPVGSRNTHINTHAHTHVHTHIPTDITHTSCNTHLVLQRAACIQVTAKQRGITAVFFFSLPRTGCLQLCLPCVKLVNVMQHSILQCACVA